MSASPKRTSPSIDQQQQSGAPRKRRARYVWRACDICRRRKGRCDGRKPCGFCRSRNAECRYSPENDPTNEFVHTEDHSAMSLPANSLTAISKGEPVSRLVYALQAQLDSLMAHVQSCSETQATVEASVESSMSKEAMSLPSASTSQNGHIPMSVNGMINHDHGSSSSAAVAVPHVGSNNTAPAALSPSSAKNLPRRFFGPTSPDYSLNAAEIKIRQAQALLGAISPETENNPSLEEDHSEDDRSGPAQETLGSSTQAMLTNTRIRQCLAQLPQLLQRNEAVRLLGVYQDVIGNLHPILDLKRLTAEAEACYNRNPKPASEPTSTQENTVLLLFLALAIALAAETVSESYVGKTLYKSVEHLVRIKLASEVTSLDHVLIALLTAICHFFNDEIRLAWRVCGISGRMAMELGLHRQDVHRHLVRDEKQYAEINALLWSIVVLDRQWSAASGLPQNFQEQDFDKAMEPPESAWYLRSMISYTFMSPKFEVPIYHVASGKSYEQEDAFEVLNFQIDQWLKKAIEGQSVFHPNPAEALGMKAITIPSIPPNPTATLLYLRANAFRSIILRPFFLSNTPSHITIKMIKPSMTIISDSIGVLTLLDSTTDVYRNQHPFFQHFLNSTCALLLLVIAYSRGNRLLLNQSSDLAEPFPGLVKKEVKRALTLAAAYSSRSQNSNRLTKRLRHLEGLLSHPEFLQPPITPIPDREQAQRSQRNQIERVNFNSIGVGLTMDPQDMMPITDDFIGADAFNGGWWNDLDMLLPNWPEPEITGHWM